MHNNACARTSHGIQVTGEASRRQQAGSGRRSVLAHGGVVARLRHNTALQPTPLTRRGAARLSFVVISKGEPMTAKFDEVVLSSWARVSELAEDGHPLSSEKTLCFLFAMELWKAYDGKLQIDFENQCYRSLPGKSKYLDLLAVTPDKEKKVAFEFKLPQSSTFGNSNQTQTRVAVYRDLARLSWLKKQGFDIGYFLMATSEDAYLNNEHVRKHPKFLTKHGHMVSIEDGLEVENIPLEFSCRFSWQGINGNGPYRRIGRYAWLDPIKI